MLLASSKIETKYSDDNIPRLDIKRQLPSWVENCRYQNARPGGL